MKYLIDETHGNRVTDPSYPGGPQKLDEGALAPANGSLALNHARLPRHGILMWILTPDRVGAALARPVPAPVVPVRRAGDASAPSRFDAAAAFDSARAEPHARIERDGARVRVSVTACDARPGITSEPLAPGEEKTLAVPIAVLPSPPDPVEWLRGGKRKTYPYPGSPGEDGYALPAAEAISVYVYHPRQDHSYEVRDLRAIARRPCPDNSRADNDRTR